MVSKVKNIDFKIFDSLPDMYFLLNMKGEIYTFNKAASQSLNLKENDTSLKFIDLFALRDKGKVNEKFLECLSKNTITNLETRFYANEKFINIRLSFSLPETINNEQTSFVIATARDITTEKNILIDLQRFFNIVENSINPVQITDLNGKMIYVNPAFEIASGYSKAELIGENPRIFGSSKQPKAFWDKMWNTVSSGKAWFGEVEDTKKNGQPYYSQLLISPMIDNDGKISGYFGIHRDMSEKKTLEQHLIQTQKMESIGTLAAGIAHEVGNPLASISALVQVAQRNTKDEFVLEKLGLVKSQVTRISKIIRDLVDFSRPSNFELQKMDINQSIKESVEITTVGTKAKDIKFELNLSNDLPSMPLVSDQLEQVFVNVLLNAVDAMNEIKDEDHKKIIRVESGVVDDMVSIKFSDTGPGIKEENLNKVFEPFFTTKKQGIGTGLGLWVSYGIIKSFHGNVKVKSENGKGTTFVIELPLNKT
ncbi:MAG: PAS domain S-box protein [Ignavibacteria bacterium]|nr:PAS domain S-box protein [Ignavibacteria bacterium]MBT8383722.1 PAS domain S-box protein [Ignavibacteria bacterium]MBT8390695.1 PAS domain S-box protein [Ignavibacteria bacterium]NNJ53319.1 PAS domain S-box protein [Ignavibacteriaceae bacterium]NNL22257.1 PAS domain S-box protein [Ignavibacteriaceae bacterium]